MQNSISGNCNRRCRHRTESTAEANSPPNWLELPLEVTAVILQKLGVVDILTTAQRVCTQWRSICKEDPTMWRTIDMRNLGDLHNMGEDLDFMCRQAVDRSCGGLVDLNVEYFGNNDLLDYVTQRCTQIRRLGFVLCFGSITDEGLCRAAGRLPLLEDLEISYCKVTGKALQKLGECCPLLKSLKINHQSLRSLPKDCNGQAMAIAKHMPELRHLQLFGNWLTNSGLEAILDGCPNLEFLDLRQCFYVTLGSSSLGKICAERIKDFRRPFDSTDDYKFDATIGDMSGGYIDDLVGEVQRLQTRVAELEAALLRGRALLVGMSDDE